jgi:D-methionine transport system permease protein
MATDLIPILFEGLLETLYITLFSTALAYALGLPMGIVLVITKRGYICPAPWVNAILGGVVNIIRSIPFLILLIAVIPFTRLIIGTSIGTTATVVPLVIGAAPYIARMVESSLLEVDRGIIEAAQSVGASPAQIVFRVLLPEAFPSLLLGAAISSTTILGYSAMAGIVGGGGLGDLAIRYGHYRYETDIMLMTIVLLVLIVQAIQGIGNFSFRKTNKKIR